MGWGTEFNYPIYLNRLIFQNKYQLEEGIEQKEKDIERIKQQILMYVSSNPKDIIPDDWKEDGVSFLQNKIDELMEDYDDNHRVLIDLYRYLEVFDESKASESDDENNEGSFLSSVKDDND